MLNTFVFGNLDSSEFDVYLTGAGVYETPARRYEKVTIEGRNGDLLINESERFPVYENVSIRYPAVIMNDFKRNYKSLKSALSANMQYAVLSDTLEPSRFRIGIFKEMTSLKMTDHLDAGTFEIIFDCKPQWFLKEGEIPIFVAENMFLFNPTSHYSKPLIKVSGNGTVGINSQIVTVTNNEDDYLFIDSETEDAYKGTVNRNSDVSFSNNEFPILIPKENTIAVDGVTLEITPRWYEI